MIRTPGLAGSRSECCQTGTRLRVFNHPQPVAKHIICRQPEQVCGTSKKHQASCLLRCQAHESPKARFLGNQNESFCFVGVCGWDSRGPSHPPGSFIAQGLNRIERGRLVGRIQPEENADHRADTESQNDGSGRNDRVKIGDDANQLRRANAR